MSMMDSALGFAQPLHQSLIPPALMARLAGNLQPMAGGVAPGQNPAMQLQNAHSHMRNRRNNAGMPPSANRGITPVQRAMMAAKEASDQQQQSQQDPPPEGAGTMSIQQGAGRDGRPVMSAQRLLAAGDQFNRENQIMGKQGENANAIWNPLDPQTFHLQPGSAQQVANQVEHAQRIGYQVTGAGQPQQQQPNPWANVLQQFKGHVPDEHLSLVDQGVQSGMLSPQQGFQHLYSAMQQAQAGQNRQQQVQSRQHMQQTHQQLTDLRRKDQELAKQNFGFSGINSDQDVQNDPALLNAYHQHQQYQNQIGTLEGQLEGGGQEQQQQTAQQPANKPMAVARNPQTGEVLHFINGQWVPAQ